MARRAAWGTPGRTDRYLHPRPPFRFLWPSLGLGVLALLALMLAHGAGLRGPVSPGGVISKHAAMESRCQECHVARQGVSNLRCQRCHDPSGAGRLTGAAHVLFGSRDVAKAAVSPDLACARCHVEHRGRQTNLAVVDQGQCASCHFRAFGAHPEFAVLRARSREVPGLAFPHQRHVEELVKEAGSRPFDTCVKCHEPSPPERGRDIEPISFERHCASCHAPDGSVGMVDPVSEQDVLSPQAIAALGARGEWLQRPEEFESGRGRIGKSVVRHRDEWVLYNMRKLRREVDPEGYAAERGAILARINQLQRRLALAAPLASLDPEQLRAREAALQLELNGVERRLQAGSEAGEPGSGLLRLEEIQAAAAAAGDLGAQDEAQRLRSQARALASPPPAALPADEHEAHRRELLGTLEAIESADASLKPRAEDLRRRVAALVPGEVGAEMLERVRGQRAAELERVRDEIRLRQSGAVPPAALLAGPQRSLRDAIAAARARLDEIAQGPPADPGLEAEARERKKQSLEVLAAACTKCHVLAGGALAPVRAARPVLVRSTFVHAPHLLQAQADCARCHPGVDKSRASADLNLRGIQGCRDCHRPLTVRQDCQACHRFHPPAVS